MRRLNFIKILLCALSCSAFCADPQPFFDGTKWGFCRGEPKDERVSEDRRNLLRDREVLIPAQFVSVYPFKNGFAAVTREGLRSEDAITTTGGKWGYIDTAGKVVVPLKYERVSGFDGELLSVKIDGKWGVISKDGKEIIPARYNELSGYHGGLLSAWDGQKHGFFDRTGRAITEMIYERVDIFTDGCARIMRDRKRGWIDAQGKEWALGVYDRVGRFENGISIVSKDGRWGCVRKNGDVLVPTVWQALKPFQSGLAAVQRDGRWGYIDTEGRVVIEPQYLHAESFYSSDLACVKLKDDGLDQYAFIDREGRFAFDHRFQRSAYFTGDVAVVCIDHKWYSLAKDGSLSERTDSQTFSFSKIGGRGPQTESELVRPDFLKKLFDYDPPK
jgi:hypothetical protein